jgi:hypothetical protein
MYFMKKVYRMLRRVNNNNRREIAREDDKPDSHFASIFLQLSILLRVAQNSFTHESRAFNTISKKRIPHAARAQAQGYRKHKRRSHTSCRR